MCKSAEVKNEFRRIKNLAFDELKNRNYTSETYSSGGIWASFNASLRYIFTEKENLVFALLQLVVAVVSLVTIGYGIWGLDEDIKKLIAQEENKEILAIYFTGWTVVVLVPTGYVLGLLSSCMNASFVLRFQGKASNWQNVIKLVMCNRKVLGWYSIIDFGYSFYHIIIKRSEKKTIFNSLIEESLFQIWKIVSASFATAILYGRNIKEACNDSYNMAKENFAKMLKLRFVYGLLFWGTWVLILVFCAANYCKWHNILKIYWGEYALYICIMLPLVLFLLVLMILIRPIYVITLSRYYAKYAREHTILARETTEKPQIGGFLVNIAVMYGVVVWLGLNINAILSNFL